MSDPVAWVGRRAGQWWVIPQHKRRRFRDLGGRCNRIATPEEIQAAQNTRGLASIFPLSFLTEELSRVVAESAQSVHSVSETAATHLPPKPKRRRKKATA
jgi:hypothetical protein